ATGDVSTTYSTIPRQEDFPGATRRKSVSPAQEDGAGGVARAYGHEQDEVAFLQFALCNGIREAERNGSGGGVGVAVDVNHDFFVGQAESLLHGADDAEIGLVRDDESDVFALKAVAFDDLRGEFGHAADGALENLRAFLVYVNHFLRDGIGGGRVERAAAGHVEKLAARPVDVVFEIDDAFVVAGGALEQDGTGAIAEQDACSSVFVIEDGGHFVGANGENLFVRAGADELCADGERVGETRAGGGKVESPGVFCADAILHQAGRGGEEHIGCDAGKNDEVNFGWIGVGLGQDQLCGFGGEMGRGNAGVGDVAFANAGAGGNPFVAGFHDFGKIVVGHH